MPKQIVVSGAFDDLRSRHLRFLEEASKLGELTVLLWPDDAIRSASPARPPKFPLAERLYFLNAVRYVQPGASWSPGRSHPDTLPEVAGLRARRLGGGRCRANAAKEALLPRSTGIEYRVLLDEAQMQRLSRAAARCRRAPGPQERWSSPAATTGSTPATCASSRRSAPTATSM